MATIDAGSIYCEHFGFAEEPFRVTPDPAFLFETGSHCEALAALIHGIRERRGFMCLVGDPGTGKTTLLNAALDRLGSPSTQARVAFLFNPADDFDELLHCTLVELGLADVQDDLSTVEAISRLNDLAIEVLNEGGTIVLVVDEAQTLSVPTLERLRLLSNLETRKHKLIQIVLSGQPGLDETLADPKLTQLRQRIGIRRHISALSDAAVTAYVEHRLRLAGYAGPPLFETRALRSLTRHSQGIPRKINILCENALIIAYALGRPQVTADMVSEAMQDLRWDRAGTRYNSGRAARAAAFAGAGALAAATAFAFSSFPSEQWLTRGFQPVGAPASLVKPTQAGDAPSIGAGDEATFSSRAQPDANPQTDETSVKLPLAEDAIAVAPANTAPQSDGDEGAAEVNQDPPSTAPRSGDGFEIGAATLQADSNPSPDTARAIQGNGVSLRLSAPDLARLGDLGAVQPRDEMLDVTQSSVLPTRMPQPSIRADESGATPLARAAGSPVRLRVAIVQPGESISKIVSRVYGHYSDEYLAHVLAINPDLPNPDRIFPGQQLYVPDLDPELPSKSSTPGARAGATHTTSPSPIANEAD